MADYQLRLGGKSYGRFGGRSCFSIPLMRICYVDEAGCTGVLPHAGSPVQPVLVIAGAVLDQSQLRPITSDFLNLKQRFFPGSQIPMGHPPALRSPPDFLDWVLAEIKGSELRHGLRDRTGRRRRRHVLGFLDHFLRFLTTHGIRIMGRVFVKGIGRAIDGRAIYTSSIQTIFSTFNHYLENVGDRGFVVMDSRRKDQNVNVAHSLFTQKFKAAGDPHPNVLEMPTFGHSENHVGIQIADLLCSALLFPMAAEAYCTGHVHNIHVQAGYSALRPMFGARLRALQYRYQDAAGYWKGGIVVGDYLTARSGKYLFV